MIKLTLRAKRKWTNLRKINIKLLPKHWSLAAKNNLRKIKLKLRDKRKESSLRKIKIKLQPARPGPKKGLPPKLKKSSVLDKK